MTAGAAGRATTQLEHFKKTVSREYTGRFLFGCHFIESTRQNFLLRYGLSADTSFAEAFGTFEPVEISLAPPERAEERDFKKYYADDEMPQGAFINRLGVLEIPGSAHHFTRYVSPLRNAKTVGDCRGFPFADHYGWSDGGMSRQVERAHAAGRVASGWAGNQYEDAWQIRGYENFLMDMETDPAIPSYILGRVHDQILRRAIALAKAGADIIRTGDDVATQRALVMRPELWRTLIKPQQREVIEVAKAINPNVLLWYHSDGDITEILPDLAEIGIDILNPLQPECMDLDKVKRDFGKSFVFHGTIGTQTTMPFGAPCDVRDAVKKSKERFGYDGALIIAPTHVLEPDVPPENVMAFLVECAKED
ncbi:MAG: hypothetical protein FWF03_08965 [Defluviitaleaceae bacterium]|nr:hypothetical protein [Defluviitaleaceae bacterium]